MAESRLLEHLLLARWAPRLGQCWACSTWLNNRGHWHHLKNDGIPGKDPNDDPTAPLPAVTHPGSVTTSTTPSRKDWKPT